MTPSGMGDQTARGLPLQSLGDKRGAGGIARAVGYVLGDISRGFGEWTCAAAS
jgi:hypothetical protein